MDPAFTFGMLLRRYRKARDLSQEALAQQAFCALDTIKKLESGRRRPSRQLATQLALVLGLSAPERDACLERARAASVPEPMAPPIPAPTTPTPAPAHRPLPHQVTPFIGRTPELARLLETLTHPQTRLLTVVA